MSINCSVIYLWHFRAMAIDSFLFGLIFGALLLGIQGERWRAAWARKDWRRRNGAHRRRSGPGGIVVALDRAAPSAAEASQQLQAVMDSAFEKRRLLSKAEAQVFHAAEQAVAATGKPWRVMAQVCLGEILRCDDEAAFRAVNSKRVDMLVVCNRSLPIAAIEYQGTGHHQGTAAARDAIKKEALRKAGVRYIEVTPEQGPGELAHEISRLAKVDELKPVRPAGRSAA